jgi:hypothetical protein
MRMKRRAPDVGRHLPARLRAVAFALVTTVAACSMAAAPAGMAFGVLGASCDPERLEAERSAGIHVVVLDLAWDRFEPARGAVDPDYVAQVREQLAACREARMQLVLGAGLQYPPDWARSLPNGTQLDQSGSAPESGTVDLVFSSAVRTAVADYFERLATYIPFDGVTAFRIGTNGTAELGYPGPEEGDVPEGSYWAYNTAAQSGVGLASGLVQTPMPGWEPGNRTWRGSPVTSAQVKAWFSWYSGALAAAVSWQAETLREVGFGGGFHIPVAGRGVLPSDLHAAASGVLDGRNNPDRALERGLYYPSQFALVAELDRRLRAEVPDEGVAVDFTGLDDDAAVRARRSDPPQDMCRGGDTELVATGQGVDEWPGLRWTTAVARRAGLDLIGENPGPPDAPYTGGSEDSDPVADQLVHGTAYARACGLDMFLFAFEDELFDEQSGISVNDYARQIKATDRSGR